MKILFKHWRSDESETRTNLLYLQQACADPDVHVQHVLGHLDMMIQWLKRDKVESQLLSSLLIDMASRHERNGLGHHIIWDGAFSAKAFFVNITRQQIQARINRVV